MQIPFLKFRLSLAAAILLCVAGSSIRAQESTPPAAPPPAKPSSQMRMAVRWKRFDYTCEGGAKLIVLLLNNSAKVHFKDSNYLMKQTPSADGERYSDGKVVWWGKGNGGFLQEDSPDGNGAIITKDCNWISRSIAKPRTRSRAQSVTSSGLHCRLTR